MYGDRRCRRRYGQRLDKELNSIIDNGYAVMYRSAEMLVKKSLAGRISGRVARFSRVLFCSHHVGNHRGKSAAAALSRVLTASTWNGATMSSTTAVWICRRRYCPDCGTPYRTGRLYDTVRDVPGIRSQTRSLIST